MKNKIAEIRKEKGYSQTKLSEEAGISRPYLSNIENDKVEATGKVLFEIAKALSTSMDSLFLNE